MNLHFESVTPELDKETSQTNLNILTVLLNNVIAPVYGSQISSIEKIQKGKDRIGELLKSENGKVLGVLIFKTAPTNEFSNYNIKNACEIKTLFVTQAENNSKKGLGTLLLNRVEDYAKKNKMEYIIVTVSDKKADALKFFEKKGFLKASNYNGVNQYKIGDEEFLLFKKII